jgi:ABC-type sugar transport system ATPase subunit
MAGITFEGVSKVFADGTAAVADLDLVIPDGEFTILVGPSGSGKSTALRMVAGLEDVTAGTIRIGDRDVTDVPPRARDIAMVFQSYALYPHMSVQDNLGFALKMAGCDKPSIRTRVGAAGGRLGISELLARRPRQLSGGQRQRVALGRAIVREPQAFLMDEPLSNLDAKLRVEMPGRLEPGAVLIGEHRLALAAPPPAAGRDVIVGIRPEALDHTRHEGRDAQPLELPVALVEALGSDTLVHLDLDATTLLTARLPPHTRARPGERLRVQVDTSMLHFFDPETEQALRAANLPA